MNFFSGNYFAGSFFGAAVSVAPVERRRAGGSRKYFAEIEGQLVGVSGIEEAEKLLLKAKREEKIIESEKRRLSRLIKLRDSTPEATGVLYRKRVEQVEQLEAKVDNRIAELEYLYAQITEALEAQSDDEEELLLIS